MGRTIRKKIIHIITNEEFITCPYCVKEGLTSIYELKFLSTNHLKKVHNKTIDDLKKDYPLTPTMTVSQQQKRSNARKKAQKKIDATYKKQNRKVGFADEEYAQKSRDTIQANLGVDNFMKSEEGRALFSGSNNPMSKDNPDSEERRKRVSEALTGVPSKLKGRSYEEIHGPEKAEQLKSDRSDLFRNKFDLDSLLETLQMELVDKEYKGSHYKHNWKCRVCGTEFVQIENSLQQGFLCPTCFPRFMGDSRSEREIREYIESLGFKPEYNNRMIIKPKELDIYIPEENIAIEHNGVYRHREEAVGKRYHFQKTVQCKDLGIKLIHIFEDEWVYKKDIAKARLAYILNKSTAEKINGRDCIIKEIDVKTKDEFLMKYHLQGRDIGSPIRLGAYHSEDLVAVMTFSKPRAVKGKVPESGHWELKRYCPNYNYIVHGIPNKLLRYFKRHYEYKSIMTYADIRWSDGDLYRQLGFTEVGHTGLDYWYSKGSVERISRNELRKRPDEPKNIPEYILRAKEGYFRVFGCGHYKFIMNK